MHRSHSNTRAALRLVALQLFAALALSATAYGSRAPGAAHAPDAAASSSGPRASDSSGVQRRRRARRRRAPEALLPGVWGGDHIRLEVTEGGATIEFDCAHGSADGKIPVDAAGRFSVAGTYYPEHGGPVREGEGSSGQPVRLAGRVGGSLMSLTVTRGRTKIGTYTLTRDSDGRVFKCR
jgi:hypothetical protein